MKISKIPFGTIIVLLCLVLVQFAYPSIARAAGPVGTGTPESCTEAALDAALSGGGAVYFDCGTDPVTITITSTKEISINTQIDGGGNVTISGADLYRVFTADSTVQFNISGLTVSHGYVNGGNGGGLLINSGATVDISDSTFDSNNTAGGYGGAIYVDAATLTISDTTFNNNGADINGLGSFALGGGAIQNNDGTVTITGSTFVSNFVNGPSADGGAIYNGDLDGGSVPDGIPDTLEVTNSTFYSNKLLNAPTGSSGGAIRSASVLTLIHDTFSNNDSGITESGGEAGAVTITHGTAILTNNIFANSTAADCAIRSDVTSLTSTGNLIENNYADPYGCGTPVTTDDPGDPFALGDNGGLTQTIALPVGSPAIDAAPSCEAGTDQREVTRPQGAKCDIGAYEYEQTTLTSTTTIASNSNPSAYGDSLIFTATVTTGATGNVEFFDGATSLGTGALNESTPNQATFNTSSLDATTHSITAKYLGDSSYGSSTSSSLSQVVNKASTTTTITGNSPDPSVAGGAVKVDFTVTSGGGTPTGNVTVTDSASSASCTATVTTGTCNITLTTAGARTLTATYAGDTNFAGSASTGTSHTVNKASTTTTITGNSPDPSVAGGAVKVDFTVTSGGGTPTGNVTVTDSASSASCTATVTTGTCNITLTTAGARTLTATYAGDTNFAGSASTGTSHTVTLVSSATFDDVSLSYWAWSYIQTLYSSGITGGCSTSPLLYCPEDPVTRAQMAVFLEKGLHYPNSFAPQNLTPTFTDTVGHWAEDWIETLKNDGITSGCGLGIYCPEDSVTRAQMAVFLLKAKYGSSYTPPTVGLSTGFSDVPVSYWAAAWIKQLALDGITGGCGNGNYCPDDSVTRAQMAVFLVRIFNLP